MDPIDEATGSPLRHRRRRCFSLLRCFSRSGGSSTSGLRWWHKIRAANTGAGGGSKRSLWARGVGALRKIREWSEIVAGPRWKTFIRRFNRHRQKPVNVAQYDPLSYALNFDEGHDDGHANADDDPHYYASRNFSSRYANGSIDFSNDGARV